MHFGTLVQKNKNTLRFHILIKNIREKDVIIIRTDRGNSVVILDPSEYLRRIELVLIEGDYTELSISPLNKLEENVLDVLKKHSNVIGSYIEI